MSISVGIISNQLWQGLSTDTKPTATDPRLRMNDVFFETETFKWLIWNGTTWNPTASAAPYLIPPML